MEVSENLLDRISHSESRLILIAKEAYQNRNNVHFSLQYDKFIADERKYMDELTDRFLKGSHSKASHHD